MKENGVNSKAVKIGHESVKALPQPFIAYWDNKHFVIVEKVTSKYTLLVDPAIGRKKVTKVEFMQHFSEIAMYVTNNGHRKIQLPKAHPIILKNIKNHLFIV